MRRICIFFSLFISINLTLFSSANGQTSSFQELDNKAKRNLEDKNYEKAFDLYAELMVYYPSDPAINYGYGVAGVQSGRYDQKVRDALLLAIENTQPNDAYLYMGKAYHANEAWYDAREFYAQFEKVASKRIRKRYYTEKLIDLCEQQKNPFKSIQATNDETAILAVENLPSQTLNKEDDKIIATNNTKDFSIPSSLEKQKIAFRIDDQRIYSSLSNFETEEGKTEFVKGWITQMLIDSLDKSLEINRKSFESEEDVYQKELLASKIISLEKESDLLQNKKQNYYKRALESEQKFWIPKNNPETNATISEAIVSSAIPSPEIASASKTENEDVKNATKQTEEEATTVVKTVKEAEIIADTTTIKENETVATDTNKTIENATPDIIIPTTLERDQEDGKIDPDEKLAVIAETKEEQITENKTELSDALTTKKENIPQKLTLNKKISTPVVIPALQTSITKYKPGNQLKTTSSSPKKDMETAFADEIDFKIPNIIYKIQIGAFKETLTPEELAILEQKYPEEIFGVYNHNGYFCITIGEETNYQEALNILKKYQDKGYQLFIVAFNNSNRISIKEAIKMN